MDEQEELAALQEQNHRIEKARAVMERDPQHNLNFGQVMSVLSMFGQRLEEEGVPLDWPYCLNISEEEKEAAFIGRERRQWNALLCAEKIVGFWSYAVVQEYLSEEDRNHLSNFDLREMIENAKLCVLLQEPREPPDFNPMGEDIVYRLSEQRQVSKPVYQATGAYRSIERILFIAYADEFNCFDATRTYPDEWKSEWEGVPSAIYASYVFAGLPNERSGLFNAPQARREFWNWWLDEAVPASWNLESLDSELRYRPQPHS